MGMAKFHESPTTYVLFISVSAKKVVPVSVSESTSWDTDASIHCSLMNDYMDCSLCFSINMLHVWLETTLSKLIMESSGSQLVESDTQTGTTSMTETLINRTYVVGDSWNLSTTISWSLFTTPRSTGWLLRRWDSLHIKTVYRRLATGTPHRTLEAGPHGSWSLVILQTPTHSLLFTHRQPVS